MKDCYKCIMENSDGLVLLKPTIYIIEGNLYYGKCEDDKNSPVNLVCNESDDECPF